MIKALKKFWKDEEGVTMIEYAIIAALIAVAAIVIISLVGKDIKSVFCNISTKLQGAIN